MFSDHVTPYTPDWVSERSHTQMKIDALLIAVHYSYTHENFFAWGNTEHAQKDVMHKGWYPCITNTTSLTYAINCPTATSIE